MRKQISPILLLILSIFFLINCQPQAAKKAVYSPVYDNVPPAGSTIVSDYEQIKDIKMGATWSSSATQSTFRFFSPRATAVDLVLYANSTDAYNAPAETIPMTMDSSGVWSVTTAKASPDPATYAGTYKYYRYRTQGLAVYSGGTALTEEQTYLPDVYSRANVGSTGHSIIIDPNAFTWSDSTWVSPSAEKVVVYETHIGDFTSDNDSPPNATISGANKGKYNGLKEAIPYFKDLGINMIELMPVHEYAVDTAAPTHETNYSWGYLPVLFFAPESKYATTNGANGEQVTELKSLINELHKNGIAVILDVVLTHTSNQYNVLFWSDPDNRYYFKIDANGGWISLGTGNWIESSKTRPFAQKMVIDNLKYWMQEFHVDGFRFDLAPGTDATTLQMAAKELKALNPNVFLTAENWHGADRHTWMVGSGFSQWNDLYRDIAKNFLWGNDVASSTGKEVVSTLKSVVYFSKGVSDVGFVRAVNPIDTLNYLESHDEATVGCYSSGTAEDSCTTATTGSTSKSAIGMTLLLTSMGTPMIYQGQEILHAKKKQGQDQAENTIDWTEYTTNAQKQQDLYKLAKYLIYLRTTNAALQPRSDPTQTYLSYIDYWGYPGDSTAKAIGYHLNVSQEFGTDQFVVLLNMNNSSKTFSLPSGQWKSLVNSCGGFNGSCGGDCGNQSDASIRIVDGVDGGSGDIDGWASANGSYGLDCYSAVLLKKL